MKISDNLKLSKFLADYIEQEKDGEDAAFAFDNMAQIISEGIDAFESVEECSININNNSYDNSRKQKGVTK